MSKKETRRRRRSAVVAVVAAVALLVTGTLAWQSISQRAVNNARSDVDETGARLHNDFDDEQDFQAGANQDIYVENYSGLNEEDPGNLGNPVYVRVRLQEYMEVGEGAGLFDYVGVTGTPGATDTPDPVDYQDLDETGTGGTRTPRADNHATPVITTNPDTGETVTVTDIDTWPIHYPGSSVTEDDSDIDYYWDWTTGGSKMFMPTFNKNNTNLTTDRTEYAQNEFTATSTQSADAFYADPAFYGQPETHTAKSTLTTADVVTMADWIAAGKPAEDGGNGYWVGDEDGWFYWSKALMSSDATGLLLDGIRQVNPPTGESYYAIHVVSQMASAGDWGDQSAGTGFYEDGLTDNALSLLNRAAGIQPTVSSITIEQGKKVFVKEGETLQLTAKVNVQNGTGDPGEQYVQWAIDDTNALFTGGVLTTEAGDVGNVYKVTATSAALPTPKSTTATVIVYSSEAERVVEGESDGKYYVDLGDNTYQDIADNGIISDEMKSAGQDEIIGNGDDKFPVHVNDDGIKLLGPNADGSYYVNGDDGKLGTADDDKVWPRTGDDINDLVDYDPDGIAYSVNLTQTADTGNGTNTVRQEGSIQYTAKVRKSDPATSDTVDAGDQTVKWELLGTYKAGTTIANTDGTTDEYTAGGVTLTIAADETVGANLLTLRATSQEGVVRQTVIISVAEKPSSPASETAVGGYFTDDADVEWKVLTEESGHKLIMTKYVYEVGTRYYGAYGWSHLDTPGNDLKVALQDFYTGKVGSDTKAATVAYVSPLPDVRSTYGGWNEAENSSTGLSHAGTDAAMADGSNAVFVLSLSEANKYLGSGDSGKIGYDATATSTPRKWWLRSPGYNSERPASFVYINGGMTFQREDYFEVGYRLALWVQS